MEATAPRVPEPAPSGSGGVTSPCLFPNLTSTSTAFANGVSWGEYSSHPKFALRDRSYPRCPSKALLAARAHRANRPRQARAAASIKDNRAFM